VATGRKAASSAVSQPIARAAERAAQSQPRPPRRSGQPRIALRWRTAPGCGQSAAPVRYQWTLRNL
jgi:hypothetical protein